VYPWRYAADQQLGARENNIGNGGKHQKKKKKKKKNKNNYVV
jgi:hypothetical protein